MRIDKDFWLTKTPIAHRGLWGNGIIENSLTAYNLAVEKGYPIEIDLYMSTDGVLFSFHDSTLSRMTGEKGYIYEKTSSEIKSLSLLNSKEKIPTFDEVLGIAQNKVPLLIEIKNQPNEKVVDKIVERLKKYKGEFALQSFNPLYIKRVKQLAPEFIRGILATNDIEDLKSEKPFTRFVIKHTALNFLIKPDFISYKYTGLPLPKHKTKNKKIITWTVTDKNIYEKVKSYCDNIIFENFIPE